MNDKRMKILVTSGVTEVCCITHRRAEKYQQMKKFNYLSSTSKGHYIGSKKNTFQKITGLEYGKNTAATLKNVLM